MCYAHIYGLYVVKTDGQIARKGSGKYMGKKSDVELQRHAKQIIASLASKTDNRQDPTRRRSGKMEKRSDKEWE